jgi:hypothetical protein
MFRKKHLIAIIIVVLLLEIKLKFFSTVFTGFAAAIISFRIEPSKEGAITYFSYPNSLTIGSPANFFIEFKNIGSSNFTSQIKIIIKDSSLQVMKIIEDENVSLVPGQSRFFTASFTPTKDGNYFVFVSVPYDGKIAEANASFTVSSKIVAPSAAPSITPISAAPSPPQIINMSVDYPLSLRLSPGQSSLISVFVKNTGNTELKNLLFTVFSKSISVESKPISIDSLKPNSSTIFLIMVNVSPEISLGNYTIDFSITSDKITKKGKIEIEIKKLRIEFELNQVISNYEYLINRLIQETYKAEKEGRDVGNIIEILNEAKEDLKIAKELFKNKDYENTKKILESLRLKIEKATLNLSESLRPSVILVPIYIPRPEFVGSLSLGLGTTFVLYYRKRKEEEEYRKAISRAVKIIKYKGE